MDGSIPSDANFLRDCLHDVVCCLDDVRRIAETVRRTSSNLLEGKPTAKDFRALESGSCSESNSGDSEWSGVLKKSQQCLTDFWQSIHRANTALRTLEPATVVAISDAFAANWTVKCQAAIDAATAWLTWTRPMPGRDSDVSRFLALTASPVPELSPAMLQLEERMKDLFALRGQVDTHGCTTVKRPKKKGARRQRRTRKEAAIVKCHKRGQRHEITARVAGVFTRDGLPDIELVEKVLKQESARKSRESA